MAWTQYRRTVPKMVEYPVKSPFAIDVDRWREGLMRRAAPNVIMLVSRGQYVLVTGHSAQF
jgi:hypothetical protein